MLKILSAAALLVVVAAGCGGAARSRRAASLEVPRALARGWEDRAEAIAVVASAGNDCRAQQLAVSLKEDVVESRLKLPRRVRSPLLTGVRSLADHTTCTPVATKPTLPDKPKPPKPKHKGHGHDKGDDRGHDG